MFSKSAKCGDFALFVQYTTVKVKPRQNIPLCIRKQTNKQTKKTHLTDAVIKKEKIYTSVNEMPQFPLQ